MCLYDIYRITCVRKCVFWDVFTLLSGLKGSVWERCRQKNRSQMKRFNPSKVLNADNFKLVAVVTGGIFNVTLKIQFCQ